MWLHIDTVTAHWATRPRNNVKLLIITLTFCSVLFAFVLKCVSLLFTVSILFTSSSSLALALHMHRTHNSLATKHINDVIFMNNSKQTDEWVEKGSRILSRWYTKWWDKPCTLCTSYRSCTYKWTEQEANKKHITTKPWSLHDCRQLLISAFIINYNPVRRFGKIVGKKDMLETHHVNLVATIWICKHNYKSEKLYPFKWRKGKRERAAYDERECSKYMDVG